MTTQNETTTSIDRTLVMIAAAGGGIVLAALAVAVLATPQASETLARALPAGWGTALSEEMRLMGLPLAGETKAYWYMARAGGIVSYLLLWLATCWGIMMSSKFIKGVVDVPVAYALHEYLPLVAMVFAAAHAIVLLGDSYIDFKPWQLLVPFTTDYEPLWTGLGTIAFYLCLAVIISTYMRKRIGQKTWRALHYVSYVGFLLALVHGLMAGTDSSSLLMKGMYWLTGGLSLFLLYYRVLAYSPRVRRSQAAGRAQ